MDRGTFNKIKEQAMKEVIEKFTQTLNQLKNLPSSISSSNSLTPSVLISYLNPTKELTNPTLTLS